MKYSYSISEVRAADNAAIKEVGSLTLMERAGSALANRVLAVMDELKIDDVLFVCGGGNNGGDGFVAAQKVLEAGKDALVLCLAERFSDDCKAVKSKFEGEIFERIPRRRFSLIVDCVFGTGLTRPPEGDNAVLIDFMNNSGAYVISCDLPSGLSEGGIALSPCVVANETLAIGACKHALYLLDGADVAGKISVADIGLSVVSRGAESFEQADCAVYFPRRKSNSHKGTYGSACILAGSSYSGAAFLSAGACLKSGAGYTRLCVTSGLYPYAVGKLPAAVLREFKAIDGEILSSDCIALGMGTGVSEKLFVFAAELLESYTGVLVLDADALNTLSDFGVELLRRKTCKVIVTPHPKEFSRLSGKSVAEILRNPVEEAKSFAKEYGVTVVLKNNRTVITDGERVAINLAGSPALAKGGSGDVLAGFLAGTVARGVAPFEAACVAAFVVGTAGEHVARDMGEYAPDASDVLAAIPAVVKELEQL